jgi:hypothetical protein
VRLTERARRSAPYTARIAPLYDFNEGVEAPHAARRGLASGKFVNELLVAFGEELTIFLAEGDLPLPDIQHQLLTTVW